MQKSQELFEEACTYIPGGVNSPVRSFGAVGSVPRFIRKAFGAYLQDEDGQSYIDYIGSWGPMILGHGHPAVLEAVHAAVEDGLSFGAATAAEIKMAKRICSMVPSVEMVRMTSSGTEAVMGALRLARGFTGRDKIIKFEGCYHGHSDAMLVKAGSGVLTGGIAGSEGVPRETAADTLVAQFNDIKSVQRLFHQNGDVAAVIVELVPANMGVVLPKDEFLQELAELCKKNGALLIADEVITGFRLGTGGAQALFGIQPDITVFGKIIGGGMPVGAFGGRTDVMRHLAPLGGVYQAGTLSGNPVAMAAGNAQLEILEKQPEIYGQIDSLAKLLADRLREIIHRKGISACVNNIGSLFTMFFTDGPVEGYAQSKGSNTASYARYFNAMLEQGIYLAPAQFEAGFLSLAHTEEDIRKTLKAAETALESVQKDRI
jgi:glutamate-1-semialdehyde 2,1-aminomutase